MPRNKQPDTQDDSKPANPALAGEEWEAEEDQLLDAESDDDGADDIERAMAEDEEPDAIDGARRPGVRQVDH